MHHVGWAQGSPPDQDAGVAQVLSAFAMRGGQLLGARRSAENPLTLTHIRWVGPDGSALEAARASGEEDALSQEERDVWVRLALHFPMSIAGAAGPSALFAPLEVESAEASDLANRAQRGRASRAPSGASYSGGSSFGGHGQSPFGAPGRQMPGSYPASVPPYSVPSRPSRDSYATGPTGSQNEPYMPGPFPRVAEQAAPRPDARPFGQSGLGQPGFGETNGWRREATESPEVAVLLAVEVELPTLLTGFGAEEYARDFARDVALHFSRAARTIAQVRETRGWMRGEALVLGTRMVVGAGMRAPTQFESENAARTLAQMLTQRTIPFSRMLYPTPGEWSQGVPLPE